MTSSFHIEVQPSFWERHLSTGKAQEGYLCNNQLIEKLDFYITSKEYRSRSILFVTSGVVDGCQGVAMGLLGVCFTKFKKSPPTNL